MKENLMAVLSGKAKASTKALFGLLVTLGSLLQVPQVNHFALSIFASHPHIVSSIGVLVTIYTLLHNPKVQAILGMEVPDNAQVSANVAVSIQPEDK